MGLFNVRVYGILLDSDQRILISDEYEHQTYFTKFPGGGLEFGEGTIEGLKREYIEECQLPIEVIRHFYTTDFFIKSAFNDTQVISIYYLIRALEPYKFRISEVSYDFFGEGDTRQAFRLVPLSQLKPTHMTFNADQHVVRLLHHIIA